VIATALGASFAMGASAQPPANGQAPPANGQAPPTNGQAPPTALGAGGSAQIFGGINQTPWFAPTQLRSQLGLTPNQFTQLNNAYAQAWSAYNSSMSQLGNLNEAQHAARMQELSNSFYQNFNQSAASILTDPSRQRFGQLGLQYRGYQAFMDPAIAQQMKLTADQQRRIALVQQQYEGRLSQFARENGPGSDRVGLSRQFNDLRKAMNHDIESVLRPTQLRQWQTMTGNWYDFDPYAGPAK
jgi:hypothetical protein